MQIRQIAANFMIFVKKDPKKAVVKRRSARHQVQRFVVRCASVSGASTLAP
jgi:hypothetical protein